MRQKKGRKRDMQDRDLFEELKRIVRCDYISDLRYDPWLSRARKEIARMDLSSYSLFALSDAAEYLYTDKQSFSSSVAAQEYFRKRLRCAC